MTIVEGFVPVEASPPGVVPGLIWAFHILEDGTASPLPVNQPLAGGQEGWLWLHLDLADVRATQWLRSAGLPDPAVETMLSHDRHQQLHATRPRMSGTCISS